MNTKRSTLADLPRVSSASAAEIVGIGYEGFRSYLKKGLLGRVGMLPGFHRAGSGTSDDPVPRSSWTTFGFADLCLMRIARMLMDSGFRFESANSVVSQRQIWSYMAHDVNPTERYLLIWPPYGDHIVFDVGDLHHLPARLKDIDGVSSLINLGTVQAEVAAGLGWRHEAA